MYPITGVLETGVVTNLMSRKSIKAEWESEIQTVKDQGLKLETK